MHGVFLIFIETRAEKILVIIFYGFPYVNQSQISTRT